MSACVLPFDCLTFNLVLFFLLLAPILLLAMFPLALTILSFGYDPCTRNQGHLNWRQRKSRLIAVQFLLTPPNSSWFFPYPPAIYR